MTRLRGVTEVSRDTVEPSSMPDRLDHYSIPALDLTGEPDMAESESIDSHKLVLRGGEVLVSRLNPRKPRVHLVPKTLSRFSVASTEFVPLQPVAVNARYLRYLLLSESVRQELDSQARSATRSHQRVEPSTVQNIQVPIDHAGEQDQIADFLDDRVGRIDQIITTRGQQRALITEHFRSQVEAQLRPFPKLPVRYLSREILVGIVIQPARLYTDDSDGVPALRGLNVGEGEIKLGQLVRITPAGHQLNPRSRLLPGDVVVVRTGDAGSAAVVPPACDDWNCIDLVIVRPARGVSAQYLELALNSAKHEASVASAASGAMQQHFGVNALGALPIPYPGEQDAEIGEQLASLRAEAAARSKDLQDSINLLAEYKQSLITAAVTGELDVTTAGSSIPG